MTRIRMIPALLCAATAAACSESVPEADLDRDLSLPPAESIATIADEPEPPDPPIARPGPQKPTPPPPAPAPEPAPDPEPQPEPSPPGLSAGTHLTVYAGDTLTSRHNEVGQVVVAVAAEDMAGPGGAVIIPRGAVFLGVITDLAPAESPGGEGRMSLGFDRVEFDGQAYALVATVDSLATHMKGRGVTAGDAAKVGVGAAVGAIAGRIIGGNRTGTAVGAVAGAAAGAGIAAATRDVDILLDAGAPIWLVLDEDFVLTPVP